MPRLALYALVVCVLAVAAAVVSFVAGQLAGDRVGAAGRALVQHGLVLRAQAKAQRGASRRPSAG